MRNLVMSNKMLASKQASKQASKHYTINYNGRAAGPDEECPCVESATALTTQGLFYPPPFSCHPDDRRKDLDYTAQPEPGCSRDSSLRSE